MIQTRERIVRKIAELETDAAETQTLIDLARMTNPFDQYTQLLLDTKQTHLDLNIEDINFLKKIYHLQ